jgi:transcriptional regulator with XRE-family HTH domain
MKKDTELRWQLVMKTRGINLTKLAKTAGLHASQISNWQNGHSTPNAVNVIKLCKAISKMTGRNYEKTLISIMFAIEIDAGVDV